MHTPHTPPPQCARKVLRQVASHRKGVERETSRPHGDSPGTSTLFASPSPPICDDVGDVNQLEARIAAAEAVSAAVRERVTWALAAFSVPEKEDLPVTVTASKTIVVVPAAGHTPVSGLRARSSGGSRDSFIMTESSSPHSLRREGGRPPRIRSPSPSSLHGCDLIEAVTAAGAQITLQLGDASRRAAALVRVQLRDAALSSSSSSPMPQTSATLQASPARAVNRSRGGASATSPLLLQRGSAAAEIADAQVWFERRKRAAEKIIALWRRFIAHRNAEVAASALIGRWLLAHTRGATVRRDIKAGRARALICDWIIAYTRGNAVRRRFNAARTIAIRLSRFFRQKDARRRFRLKHSASVIIMRALQRLIIKKRRMCESAQIINRVWRGALVRHKVRQRLLINRVINLVVDAAAAATTVSVLDSHLHTTTLVSDDDNLSVDSLQMEEKTINNYNDNDDDDRDSWGELRSPPSSSQASFIQHYATATATTTAIDDITNNLYCCELSLVTAALDDEEEEEEENNLRDDARREVEHEIIHYDNDDDNVEEEALLAEALAPSRGWGGGGEKVGFVKITPSRLLEEAIEIVSVLH